MLFYSNIEIQEEKTYLIIVNSLSIVFPFKVHCSMLYYMKVFTADIKQQ
jgi:hypothetical protein